MMNIHRGLTTDDGTEIPWQISLAALKSLVGPDCLSMVKRDYFVTRCRLFGGLDVKLGFHFSGEALQEFEIFRNWAMPLEQSYAEFQQHLEAVFGQPTQTIPGDIDSGCDCGFAHHEWRFGHTRVRHFVLNRFGCEEHVRISK